MPWQVGEKGGGEMRGRIAMLLPVAAALVAAIVAGSNGWGP